MVGPTKVDANGCFLSYNLQHHTSSARRKRDLSQKENFVYYKISHKEKNLFFNLTVNEEFLSNNYVLERRYGNYTGAKVVPRSGTSCHFIGVVLHPDDGHGTAVISTCNGLVSDVTLLHGAVIIFILFFFQS